MDPSSLRHYPLLIFSRGVAGRGVSFQITILKVLAGHPEGRVSLADLKQYVAVLTCSGADWSQRMKRLAARAPGLDIFSSGYVLREPSGWQITDEGREFLSGLKRRRPTQLSRLSLCQSGLFSPRPTFRPMSFNWPVTRFNAGAGARLLEAAS